MDVRCTNCRSALTTGGLCTDPKCPLSKLTHIDYQKTAPDISTYGIAAGHCGKCGAPYYHDGYAGVKPICACWNLVKVTYGSNT